MMTEETIELTSDERADLMHRIAEAIAKSDPDPGRRAEPMLVGEQAAFINHHLPRLVEIVRRCSSCRVESYLSEIRHTICPSCRFQTVSGWCPLRETDTCALFSHLRPIVEAIDDFLRAQGQLPPRSSAAAISLPIQAAVPATTAAKEHTMFKRILVGVDHTAPAERAAKEAYEMAKSFGAQLGIVHVVSPSFVLAMDRLAGVPQGHEEELQHGHTVISDIRNQLGAYLPMDEFVVVGTPAEQIVKIAKEWDADLVVVGNHNRHALSRFLLGSTADATVRHAPCPVLVVRETDVTAKLPKEPRQPQTNAAVTESGSPLPAVSAVS